MVIIKKKGETQSERTLSAKVFAVHFLASSKLIINLFSQKTLQKVPHRFQKMQNESHGLDVDSLFAELVA